MDAFDRGLYEYSAPEVEQQLDHEQRRSTLEVGQRPDPSQVYSTLESRQPDVSLFDSYKQAISASPQPEIFDAFTGTPGSIESHEHTAFTGNHVSSRKRNIWILVALGIATFIAAAAIGGGVGGTRHHTINSASPKDQAPSPVSANLGSSSLRPSSSPSSIVPSVSASTTSSSSFHMSTFEFNTTMLNVTRLASLSWNLNGATEYRVWYQTQDNMIREVGKNDTGNQWYSSGPSHGPAKRGSPLSVSYTGPPNWLIEIDLFYIADNDSIILTKFVQNEQRWVPGSLNYIPAVNSNLATLWFRHQYCNGCSNDLLLVCQTSDDKLALFNSTSAGPQWVTLEANAIPGTGLSFNLLPGPNDTGTLLLFYQTANQGLCSTDFNESQGWTVNEGNPISEIPTQAPFAGFTWNQNGTFYMDIVSTGPKGVTVSYFNSTTGNWTSVPSSELLAQVQNYSAIAATDASHMYALQDGNLNEYRLAPDGVTWLYVDGVDTL